MSLFSKPFRPSLEPNCILPPRSSTNLEKHRSWSPFEHQRITNLCIFDCTSDGLLDINPLSIQIIVMNSPLISANCYSKELLHYVPVSSAGHSCIPSKTRSRLFVWSVLPIQVPFSVHRNLKDKDTQPICFLPPLYHSNRRARKGSSQSVSELWCQLHV